MQKTNHLTQEIADALGFEVVNSKKMFHPVLNLQFYDAGGLFEGRVLLSQFLNAVEDWVKSGGPNGLVRDGDKFNGADYKSAE